MSKINNGNSRSVWNLFVDNKDTKTSHWILLLTLNKYMGYYLRAGVWSQIQSVSRNLSKVWVVTFFAKADKSRLLPLKKILYHKYVTVFLLRLCNQHPRTLIFIVKIRSIKKRSRFSSLTVFTELWLKTAEDPKLSTSMNQTKNVYGLYKYPFGITSIKGTKLIEIDYF